MKPPLQILLVVSVPAILGWLAGRALIPPPVEVTPDASAKKEKLIQDDALILPTQARPIDNLVLRDRWDFAEEIKSAPMESLETHLKTARSFTDPLERKHRVEMVGLRYAVLGPEKCLEKSLQSDLELSDVVVRGWAATDPKSVLEWGLKQPGLSERQFVIKAAATSFAKSNPDGMVDYLNGERGVMLSREDLSVPIFRTLAMSDPSGATEKLQSVKNPLLKLGGFTAVAETWAQSDPEASLAWAKSLGDPKEKAHALQGAIKGLAATDPRAAIKALDLVDPSVQINAITTPHFEIAAGLAKLDLKEALAWVKSLDATKVNLESILTNSVLPTLPKMNATALVDLFKGVDVGGRNSDFADTISVGGGMLSVLLQWKPEDVRASLKEVAGMESSEARDTMVNYLAWQMAKSNPTEALAYAANATELEKDRISGHLAKAMGESGKIADIAQAINLTKDESKMIESARLAAIGLAAHHPELALELISKLPPATQAAAAAKMAPGLVARDPQGALALSANMPAEAQNLHASIVAAEWAKLNPNESSRWAATLPAGPMKDSVATGLVSSLYQKDPQNAFGWAKQIVDTDMRRAQLQSVVQEWLQVDAGAARLSLMNAGLPPQEVAAALAPVLTGGPNKVARKRDFVDEPEPETDPNLIPAPHPTDKK